MGRGQGVRIVVLGGAWIVGAGSLAPAAEDQLVAQAPLKARKIPQFVDPLPTLGNGIEVAGGETVELSVCEFEAQVLPTTLSKQGSNARTWVWGYRKGSTCPSTDQPVPASDSYIGPVIVAQRGEPTDVTYSNRLGDAASTHVIAYKQSVDQTLMWADPMSDSEDNTCAKTVMGATPGTPPSPGCAATYAGPIPVAPHLHGGEVPAAIDGGPDAWWTFDGRAGHGYYSTGGRSDARAGRAVYRYPNTQEASPIWFHDHVLGATRLNVYAGIAGAYVITDPKDENPNYPAQPGLPPVTQVVPIVIQDRMFDSNGQLLMPAAGLNLEHPYWVPEFVGDVIVVNGKTWPYLQVEPRRYRFLFLNGSNARAYELYLIDKTSGVKGPVMWVIGTDQGYLDAPVKIDPNLAKPNDKLVIMPGERYDVVIDFAAHAGATLRMVNTARTPYPFGAPVDGNTTGRIMEFRVAGTAVDDASWNPALPGATVRVADSINRFYDRATGLPTIAVQKTRRLTLNEGMGPGGPMEVLVNNTRYAGDDPRRTHDDFEPITTEWNVTHYSELPHEGETELWEIVNVTADAHPIHPHLVAFQILDRQAFDLKAYDTTYNASFPGGLYLPGFGPPLPYACATGRSALVSRGPSECVLGGNPDVTPFLVGPPRPPAASEAGWKDTAISYPGEVLRILVRFAPTTLPASTPTTEAHYEFDPGGGHGYVWHCHIIDHEDNEMMRPLDVQALDVEREFDLP